MLLFCQAISYLSSLLDTQFYPWAFCKQGASFLVSVALNAQIFGQDMHEWKQNEEKDERNSYAVGIAVDID